MKHYIMLAAFINQQSLESGRTCRRMFRGLTVRAEG